MTNNTILPDVSEGVAEPSASRVILVLMSVGLVGLIALFSNIFGWDTVPVIGDIIPFMDNLGGSGIWYYLIGILVGCGMIIANLIGGVLSTEGGVQMSEAFTTSGILLATLLLFSYYIQKGFGGMSVPLRQFGMFLLTKAAGPAADLFQEREGSGAKTWMQTGVFWLILAAIGGFLSAWHNYDPAALDSLSNIGWAYDDGSALTYFNEVAMSTAIFAILVGGSLVAHTRTTGAKLASEANASMIAMAWTAQVLVGLVLSVLDHWDWIVYGTSEAALYGLVSGLLVLSLLVNSLITLGSRGNSPISVPSWFLVLALFVLIFSRFANALGETLDWTGTVWVVGVMASGWVPLALMFGVGYHVLSHVTGQPIWSGSMTKASMFLLFVTVPPFFLAESSHADNFTQSIGAILVTVGLMPIMAASANMLATIRGNASAVVDSPGQRQQLEQQFCYQSMHFSATSLD